LLKHQILVLLQVFQKCKFGEGNSLIMRFCPQYPGARVPF
jgi:hypothetical protein